MAGKPLLEQVPERHAGADRGALADLDPEPVAQLEADASVASDPVIMACFPVTGSVPPKIRT